MSAEPAMPLRPRESIPWGEAAIETARMCSSRPGVARSTTRGGGLGRHVARGEAGASRGEDELGRAGQLAERLLDGVRLVGDGAAPGEVEPGARQALGEEIAAQILAGAGGHAVGDGEDGSPHSPSRRHSPLFPPDFSTSTISSIEEFGSSPFVMS